MYNLSSPSFTMHSLSRPKLCAFLLEQAWYMSMSPLSALEALLLVGGTSRD